MAKVRKIEGEFYSRINWPENARKI